nr:CARDB domain-containing protein [Pyxidicoccus fallax]
MPLWLAVGLFAGAGCGGAVSPPPEDTQPQTWSRPSALTFGPDLVVTKLSTPRSALPGQPFKATVTVCNQGSEPATTYYSWPWLELYLSTDTSLSMPSGGPLPPDQQLIGNLQVPPLDPAQCVTREVDAYASLPPDAQGDGAYYVGAIVDVHQVLTEADETNNAFVSEPMGVGFRPDLVVTEVKGPTSIRPGQSFTATVTVCNQGTQYTYSSAPVELYLSMDDQLALPAPGTPLPTDQRMIGQVNVHGLAAGQCATRAVQVHADLPPDAQGDGAYYLGAIVDPYQSEQELREDNNTFVTGKLGVGFRSDLVVTEVKGPASVRHGEPFTTTVTVCNQGTESAYNSAPVELYLSMDDQLTPPAPGTPLPTDQRMIGQVNVHGLQAGQCATRAVQASAWLPQDAQGDGAYYLGAIVDPYQSEQELREDNNTSVAGKLGVGFRSDLVVTKVTSPASVRDGQSFTATVTVCNQGTESAYSSVPLELYLSTDTTLTAPAMSGPGPMLPMDQRMIGSAPVPYLSPGQCVDLPVQAYAYPPPDVMEPNAALYLGAIVDPYQSEQELREDNNTFIGGLVGVGHRADLVVTKVTAPASVRDGQSFTASVTVCNQGTEYSNGYGPLELYFSTNATLTLPNTQGPGPMLPTSQRMIGSLQLSSLYAGQCVTRDVQAQAYLPPDVMEPNASLYVGAIVDPYGQEQELREDNNAFVGGLMGVGHRADLVVTKVTTPASVRDGQSFTASVTVCNQGTEYTNGGSTQLELYFSMDATLSLPNTQGPGPMPTDQRMIGSLQQLPSLYAGQCVTRDVQAQAYLPPDVMEPNASLYVGAIVDPYGQEQELREDNNTFISGLVGVGHLADLVVTKVTAPANVRDGSTFTATVTVCNQGTEYTNGYGQVELYLSTNATLSLPNTQGPGPMLPMEQRMIGSTQVPSMYAGQCMDLPVQAYAYPPPTMEPRSAFYLGAIVDPYRQEQELREDNNTFTSGFVGMGWLSDLVVTKVTAPANVRDGSTFTAAVTVCNQGTEYTNGYSQLELYLSTNTTLTLPNTQGPGPMLPMEQRMIGSAPVPYLYPGQCVDLPVQAQAYPPPDVMEPNAALYLGAIVDPYGQEQELREDNNTFIGGLVGVGHLADLVVTSVTAPASVRDGSTFTAAVTVCNQGTEYTNGGSTQLELYFSTDTTLSLPNTQGPGPMLPMDQRMIGSTQLPSLYAGQCVTRDVQAQAYLPPDVMEPNASLYVGAIVDPYGQEQELREDNNTFIGNLVGVGQRPDLVVTKVTAPASVRDGQSFTASVTVCNQGNEFTNGYGQLELYLSTDTTLSLPNTQGPGVPMPTDQRMIGSLQLPSLYAGQCVTRDVQAQAYLPPDVMGPNAALYLGAIVDPYQSEQELREDNNTFIGGLVGVGQRADLVVTKVTAPASVRDGSTFTASVTVCNQGTEYTNGYGQLELYFSTDAALSLPNPQGPGPMLPTSQRMIGSTQVPSMYAGQCVDLPVQAQAYPPPDVMEPNAALYLGAIVDPYGQEQELREDNNAFVGDLVGVGHLADLVVTKVTAPASVRDGHPFTASVTVCNQGTEYTNSGSNQLELYLSTDTTLTLPNTQGPGPMLPMDQRMIGSTQVPSLYAGQCVDLPVQAQAYPPPDVMEPNAALYLGAIVDPYGQEQELREDNNAFVGGLVGVGHLADLVVTSVTAPASVRDGQSFTASVTVCNQGTEYTSGYGQLELYLSMDATLSLPNTQGPGPMPTDQRMIGSTQVPSLYAGQCATRDMQAQAYLPPDVMEPNASLYVGAIVDPYGQEQELREDNNTFIGGLVGVGQRADLVVTKVTAPASVRDGSTFTAAVTVCNQGTEYTNGYGQLELYLSTDTTLSLPNTQGPGVPMPTDQRMIGLTQVPYLYAGQCVDLPVQAQAYLPPDVMEPNASLYVGAIVDPYQSEQELREDNNAFIGDRVGVGHLADLVVTKVTAPASVRDGHPFAAKVTVCNQGTEYTNSGSNQVELYLSTDATLTPPNTQGPGPMLPTSQRMIGSTQVPSMYAGQCVDLPVQAQAYPPPDVMEPNASLYLGAIVDPYGQEQELREDNNTFVGDLVGVGHLADLVVTSVTAPASVRDGHSFTASVTVCNQGTEYTNGGSTQVELYLSTDTTLSLPNTQGPGPMPTDQRMIGSTQVPSLYAGQCVTRDVQAQAYLPPDVMEPNASLYVGAIVDPYGQEQELREDNNTFIGGLVGVGQRPDLVVTKVTAPANVRDGSTFTATVTVCNQGTEYTNGYGQVELYLSTNATLSLPNTQGPGPMLPMEQRMIGSAPTPYLHAGQCMDLPVQAQAYPPPTMEPRSAFYLGAIVDPYRQEQELREDNNTFTSGFVGVGWLSDLVVTKVTAPTSVRQGDAFTAAVTVCNEGTQDSGGSWYGQTQVELYLSMDATLTLPNTQGPSMPMPTDQRMIGTVTLLPLQPGQCVTENVNATADLPYASNYNDGAYYLGAIVDPQQAEQELREDNNTFAEGLLGVGLRSDLVVTELSAPASVQRDAPFTATVKVCNQGTEPVSTGYPRVELYLSTDTTLAMPDPQQPGPRPDQSLVGMHSVSPLAPGQCETLSVQGSASPPPEAPWNGSVYLAAIVDGDRSVEELREDNNILVGDLMGVGERSDLVVTELSAPTTVRDGDPFTATVKVCNQGTTALASPYGTHLELYISMDTTLTPPTPNMPWPTDQHLVGNIQVSPLAAGQCETLSVQGYAYRPPASQGPGSFFLGALVDPGHTEEELREDNNARADFALELTP